MTTSVTDDWIREFMAYDPETGALVWKAISHRRINAVGDHVGRVNTWGYLGVCRAGKTIPCHRIGWFLHYGAWPSMDLDHINGNKLDNSIENLREVDRSTNMENFHVARKDNKSGLLGVSIDAKKRQQRYKATIKVKGKSRTIGRFYTAEEAHLAYLEAKRLLHKGCTI